MSKHVTFCTWDEVPHLTQVQKDDLWTGIPEYLREARSKGIPAMGEGAVYPVPDSELIIDDLPEIPVSWPRAYGLDVGWLHTACIWGALNRETDILYLYKEYDRGKVDVTVHAAAIKGPDCRDEWIPGVIDPGSQASSQADGAKLFPLYKARGLDIVEADNEVEPGIQEVLDRMTSGRLKVFRSLNGWLEEKRLYRRAKNKVVKEKDHRMDATRYLVVSGIKRMKTRPMPKKPESTATQHSPHSWMA